MSLSARSYFLLIMFLIVTNLGGCNSHATFEDNSFENCFNDFLDPGEACDSVYGVDQFQEGDSCEARGYAGGTLWCYDCTVVTSNCIPAATDCSPFTDEGCEDTVCYFDPNAGTTFCADMGGGFEGEACDVPSDCASLMTCLVGTCRRVCNPGATDECQNDAECMYQDWGNEDIGLCPLPFVGCDPVVGIGCDNAGDACYLQNARGDGFCSANVGGEPTGGPCGADVDCQPGNVCLQLTDPSQSYCTRLCDASSWCDGGSAWCAYHPAARVGFCVDPELSCDPLNSTTCPNGSACVVVNTYGTTTCMYTHGIQEGEACDLFNRCEAGLYCATDLDWKCHRLCQAMADCNPDECFEMQDWPQNNGQAGYCRPPQ
ncbi:MAG: hypothetical protein CVU59_05910 [Deltaproteobacteria bacterium HGW-Deltaproteobacteria-17]|nr:MAG: hypothetical protein CVU59_05910 [Deltaproteobacteria bacterium HGW-Deltaproteobacteria-17]